MISKILRFFAEVLCWTVNCAGISGILVNCGNVVQGRGGNLTSLT